MKRKIMLVSLVIATMLFTNIVFADSGFSAKNDLERNYSEDAVDFSVVDLIQEDFSDSKSKSLSVIEKSIGIPSYSLRSEPIDKMPIGGGGYPYNPGKWNSSGYIWNLEL